MVAHYTVRMPQPASHNFEVEIELSGLHGDVTLAFPAWTPGSYKVRDFTKNVSAFKAGDARGDLEVEILDKQRFRIHDAREKATATFTLYADEFSVRTPHLDDQHGFFLGTNLLPYIERGEGLPQAARYVVTIEPPKGWQVATGLPPVKGQKNTWCADDYDILGDSIFEIGVRRQARRGLRGLGQLGQKEDHRGYQEALRDGAQAVWRRALRVLFIRDPQLPGRGRRP
jgi:predicted metalloprotease with PDZ domain